MNAAASPFGAGGGARHIALGVGARDFPIDSFLLVPGKEEATVVAESLKGGAADLLFRSNPDRRGGEWTIRDQYTHRHPAWEPSAGFPVAYDANNPPFVFVAAIGTRFFARFSMLKALQGAANPVPPRILAEPRGIVAISDSLRSLLQLPSEDALDAFEEQIQTTAEEPFNPTDLADGRQLVFAAIRRRQGQAAFRKGLLGAYKGRCAITRTSLPWILEAAHIVPYKGPKTNTLENGLLLRADVHTLFDLGLVAVDPSSLTVRTSSLLSSSPYAAMNGRALLQPGKLSERPSIPAIAEHFKGFRA